MLYVFGVCQRKWKSEWTVFFYTLFPFFLALWLQGSYLPQCPTICPSFLSYWKSLSHDQSVDHKGQGCDFCIPLSILPPSMHLILTQKDSANSFPQIWARVCKQAFPSYAATKHGTWCFFVKCTLKQQHLHNTFQIYSRVFWRTRHICYLAIDMLLKTAASGTTVKYALSMTEPSSIMRTSIPSLFPHHFLDLRENIAPWSESIPSYKPLKTT